MQKLKLHPDFFDNVGSNFCMADVRVGRRDIQLGDLTFEATDGSKSAVVEVIEVAYTKLKNISDTHLAMRGQHHPEDVMEGLKPFYPELGPDSEITVITFLTPE